MIQTSFKELLYQQSVILDEILENGSVDIHIDDLYDLVCGCIDANIEINIKPLGQGVATVCIKKEEQEVA